MIRRPLIFQKFNYNLLFLRLQPQNQICKNKQCEQCLIMYSWFTDHLKSILLLIAFLFRFFRRLKIFPNIFIY